MAQVRSDFSEGMKKDGYDYFYESHDQHASIHPLLFRQRSLEQAWEQWTSIVEENKPERKTSESQDAPVSDTVEGFTVVMQARTYHRRKVWSKETVRDIKKLGNLVQQATSNWGNGVFIVKEEFYADFFNSGGLTAGKDATFDNSIPGLVTDDSGDGVYDGTAASVMPFFNLTANARSSKGGSTYFNGIALSLSEANLETALIRGEFTNAFSERDQRMRQIFDTLLIPVHLDRQGRKLMGSDKEPDTDKNAINPFMGKLNIVTWRFLTDTNAWFIGVAKKGIVMGNRQDPEINMFIDQRNGNFEAVLDLRFGGAVEDFRPWVGSNFNTT
jgi:hypothetical protein